MSNIKKHLVYLSHFATGQFLLQVFSLLNGFFLLRWLSVSEQAKFSVAFSIQSLILSLSDLGFTGSIIALVGHRIDDKRLVGAYIQSAKRLRNYLFFFSCGIALIVLPFIIRKQSWGYVEMFIILLPVLLAVFWQADCSLYDSTLVMHKKMKELYKPQVGLAATKLVINFTLSCFGIINAFSTLFLNAVTLLINGKIYKRNALPFIDVSKKNNNYDAEFKEMINYLKPLFPSLIFNALYGQVQVFLISFFGKTSNIAEVAALGKLSQMFVFLASLNGMIISPLMARTTTQEFTKKYFLILSASFSIAFIIYLSSLLMPGFFLLLLGPKYYHLRDVLSIMILTASVNYVSATMWTMGAARKWIFGWATGAYIVMVILLQIYGILILNLSTTLGVLKLSLITSIGILILNICNAAVGFRKSKNLESKPVF